jgi:chromosome segregation ATPase
MSYTPETYGHVKIDAILDAGMRKIRETLTWCYDRLAWHEEERNSILRMRDECKLAQKNMDNHWRDLQVERDREHKAARASRAALLKAQGQLEEYQRRADSETVKARVAERALEEEKRRADRLERRVRKLELAVARGKSRRAASGESLLSAIEKLTTRSPVVGKRIAAACHPDKVPSDCSELASELFRLIQNLRGTA